MKVLILSDLETLLISTPTYFRMLIRTRESSFILFHDIHAIDACFRHGKHSYRITSVKFSIGGRFNSNHDTISRIKVTSPSVPSMQFTLSHFLPNLQCVQFAWLKGFNACKTFYPMDQYFQITL